jgi:hypothetical protein
MTRLRDGVGIEIDAQLPRGGVTPQRPQHDLPGPAAGVQDQRIAAQRAAGDGRTDRLFRHGVSERQSGVSDP